MAHPSVRSLLPLSWQVPDEFHRRLGDQPGRQRTMKADGHLLVILHAPPKPDETEREGRFFWRDANGQWTPPDGLALQPWYLNLFENIATVQFQHRLLAVSLVALVAATWFYGRNRALTPRAHALRHALMIMALVQAGLGISTLLMVVPLGLALTHQMGALALFTLAISFAYAVRPAARPHETLDLSVASAE